MKTAQYMTPTLLETAQLGPGPAGHRGLHPLQNAPRARRPACDGAALAGERAASHASCPIPSRGSKLEGHCRRQWHCRWHPPARVRSEGRRSQYGPPVPVRSGKRHADEPESQGSALPAHMEPRSARVLCLTLGGWAGFPPVRGVAFQVLYN